MKISLSRNLAVATLLFAVLISLLLTGIDLWQKLRVELRATNIRLGLIETSIVPSIADTLWQFNIAGVRLIAEGIAKQPDVSRVFIHDKQSELVSIGKAVPGSVSRQYHLKHPVWNQKTLSNSDLTLGILTVEIDQPAIEHRIITESLTNLFFNMLLIVLVAGFVLLLLEFKVMRYLRKIARFVDSRNTGNLNESLSIGQRHAGISDELAMLVSGVTRMQDNLRNTITQLQDDIQKRELAEASLRIAATAFESQEGMYITDAAQVILQVNATCCEISGYTSEEIIGNKPIMFGSGRHDAAFFSQIETSIQQNGTWKGEIWDRRKSGEVYPQWLTITAVKNALGELTNFVATMTDITYRKAAEEEIYHLAFYDSLTQLPNRRLLLDRLKQALASSFRSGKHGALLFIDLDNFKILNDSLGHDIGDLLLQEVSKRLSNCVREGDTVARLGGDEFVVMLEDLSEDIHDSAKLTETIGEKILNVLGQTYQLDGHLHHSTPSIGVTLFSNNLESIDELMKRADMAMYQAKAAGRNTLRFFDPEMQAAASNRTALEADLRQAILEGQLLLHYQAQVSGNGLMTGSEVLLRWQHPQRGLVPPADFIPLAEDTGLILPIGHWVLETACMQQAAWAARPEMAHLTIAVNVSALQFRQDSFVEEVLAIIGQTGANPLKLKLELTESLLVEDVDDIIAKMTALKAKGISFALDDFGTGYSSLSYLKRLPLDQLKIDQSFVRNILTDPNDAAIAKMVVALSESLGLSVIAEGVETEEQRAFLALHGCSAYQGYLFSRPLPLKELEEYIKQA